jgi:ABC-2 type transport system ATP-binding protein
VIAGLRDLGKTIFLTTHYMDEAEALADQIVILAAGKVVAAGTPATIGGRATSATTVSFTLPDGLTPADLPADLPALAAAVSAGYGGQVEILHEHPVPLLHALSTWALERGYPLADISVHRPTLEEIYLRLTQETT